MKDESFGSLIAAVGLGLLLLTELQWVGFIFVVVGLVMAAEH